MDRELFTPIDGLPGDEKMVLLCETLLNTRLSVHSVVADVGCASGVVLIDNTYQKLHANTFTCMITPLAAYDPNITVLEGCLHANKKSGRPS